MLKDPHCISLKDTNPLSIKATMATKAMSCQSQISSESDYNQDDFLINGILNGGTIPGEVPADFSFGDTVGKIDDAVDYEDISDGDLLPDEEFPSLLDTTRGVGGTSNGDLCNTTEEVEGSELNIDFDDLFGDLELMNNTVVSDAGDLDMELTVEDLHDGTSSSTVAAADEQMLSFPRDNTSRDDSDAEVSSQINRKEPTTQDLVKRYFPDFEPHKILSFSSLFKPKPTALSIPFFKPPKVCVPTKANLEMAADDQSYFIKAMAAGSFRVLTDERVIVIPRQTSDMKLDGDEECTKNGFRDMFFEKDLVLACDDWESRLDTMMMTPPQSPKLKRAHDMDAGGDAHRDCHENKVCYFCNLVYNRYPWLRLGMYSVLKIWIVLLILSRTRG